MTGEDNMNTAAISKNNTMTMNKKTTWVERFKNYLLDNADYFAASSAMMTGNSYTAVQIMKDSRRYAAKH